MDGLVEGQRDQLIVLMLQRLMDVGESISFLNVSAIIAFYVSSPTKMCHSWWATLGLFSQDQREKYKLFLTLSLGFLFLFQGEIILILILFLGLPSM